MKLFELQGVKRKHGRRTVLDIDHLEIDPGKIYTLIGPNGAGKTTLLKILSFLDIPTSGSISFMGQNIKFTKKSLYKARKKVVLLDQYPIMFTGSVFKNIEFGLKVRGISSPIRAKKIGEALELVGMERFRNYDARGLSGGETKRVALARALVLEPEVLLCDEPTANVDGENQDTILKIITRINRTRKTSIIFSTHYLSQGQKLADHSLLLQYGKLSDLVAENIFRTTIVAREQETIRCQLTGQLSLILPIEILPQETTVAKIHIDPEQISCNPNQENDVKAGNTIKGHISELSQESGRVRIGVDVGVRLVLFQAMQEYLQQKPGIGEKVTIYIPNSSIEFTHLGQPVFSG